MLSLFISGPWTFINTRGVPATMPRTGVKANMTDHESIDWERPSRREIIGIQWWISFLELLKKLPYLGGLKKKHTEINLLQFWRLKVQIKVSTGSCSLKLLPVACNPWQSLACGHITPISSSITRYTLNLQDTSHWIEDPAGSHHKAVTSVYITTPQSSFRECW